MVEPLLFKDGGGDDGRDVEERVAHASDDAGGLFGSESCHSGDDLGRVLGDLMRGLRKRDNVLQILRSVEFLALPT